MSSKDDVIRVLACVGQMARVVPAQQVPLPDPGPDVVVRAFPPRCKPRPDDPQNAFIAGLEPGRGGRIAPDGKGEWRVASPKPSDRELPRSWGTWWRAGTSLSEFVFRTPTDGSPACIARRGAWPVPDKDLDSPEEVVVIGHVRRQLQGAQIEQSVRAGPYRCRIVRLTALVATQQAQRELRVNAGYGAYSVVPVRGSHGWRPVSITDGPVGWWYPWTGFGLAVTSGDAWLYQPRVEVLPEAGLTPRQRRAEQACQSRESIARMADLIGG